MQGRSSILSRWRPSGTSSPRRGARELDSPLGRLDQTHLAVSYLVHPTGIRCLAGLTTYAGDGRGFAVVVHHTHYGRTAPFSLLPVRSIPSDFDRIEAIFGGLVRANSSAPRLPPRAAPDWRRDFALVESDSVAR